MNTPIAPPKKVSNKAKKLKKNILGRMAGLCVGALMPIAIPLLAAPAVAAERVTLTYGFVEISTTVDDLQSYADTGVPSRELNAYLRFLSAEQQDQFRQALQVRQDVDHVQISRFLYSALGENLTRVLGGIIQTQGRRDGARGLRGALVLAAAEPEGLSLLGVLDKFPTDNVRIDSQRAFQAIGALTRLIQNTERAIAAIQAQSTPRSILQSTVPALEALSQPGPYTVSVRTITVADGERSRDLITDLYLPVNAPPAGIVVISHGLAGDRKGFDTVAEHLASHGYAIAALEHPGSNTARLYEVFRGVADEVADPTEFSDRPRDVSYLLDELTRLNAPGGTLAGQLDPERIGIIGHSFGGYTALALSGAQLDYDTLRTNCSSTDFIYSGANPSIGLQCTALLAPHQFSADLEDDRIQAVIALNPVTSSLFGPQGFAQIDIPSLIVSGSVDPLAPALLEQIRPFTWLNKVDETDSDTEQPAHYLALIEGGSHLYDPLEVEGAERVAIASNLVNADPELAYSYLKALSLGFLRAELEQDPIYQTAFDDASIVQLGTQPLPLYIVRDLTEAMLNPPPAPPPEITPPETPNIAPPTPNE
ncbi:MAG: alpha/beta hydrolase [Cyanobacteria bacterium J06629_19]